MKDEKLLQFWLLWVLLEAATRLASKILQKVIGVISTAVSQLIFILLVSSVIQLVGGLVASFRKGQSVFVGRRSIAGAAVFGFIGGVMSLLVYYIFFIV